MDAKTGQPLEVAQRINVCTETIDALIALTLTPPDWKAGDPPPPAVDEVLKAIDRFAAAHQFSAAPAPTARPTCAPDPAASGGITSP
jgi:hypothetical protein